MYTNAIILLHHDGYHGYENNEKTSVCGRISTRFYISTMLDGL